MKPIYTIAGAIKELLKCINGKDVQIATLFDDSDAIIYDEPQVENEVVPLSMKFIGVGTSVYDFYIKPDRTSPTLPNAINLFSNYYKDITIACLKYKKLEFADQESYRDAMENFSFIDEFANMDWTSYTSNSYNDLLDAIDSMDDVQIGDAVSNHNISFKLLSNHTGQSYVGGVPTEGWISYYNSIDANPSIYIFGLDVKALISALVSSNAHVASDSYIGFNFMITPSVDGEYYDFGSDADENPYSFILSSNPLQVIQTSPNKGILASYSYSSMMTAYNNNNTIMVGIDNYMSADDINITLEEQSPQLAP